MGLAPIRRILVPTDFSETADEALGAAIELGRPSGALLDVVHVTAPVVVLPPPFDLVSMPSLFPELPRRIEESLQARAGRVREAGLPCETTLLEGPPHHEIVRRAADTQADLIVMGTHGRGGIGHAVLGSVAERVVHRAHCPVLVVPVRAR